VKFYTAFALFIYIYNGNCLYVCVHVHTLVLQLSSGESGLAYRLDFLRSI